jgi:hypothetical protein
VNYTSNFQCAKCAAILRELMTSGREDFRDRKDKWIASGRSLEELRDECLASIAHDDSSEWLQHPRTDEALRKKAEHEAVTGHSVYTHGFRFALSGPNL